MCPVPPTTHTLCFPPLSLPLSLCLLLLVLELFLYPQLPGLQVWKFQVYTQDKHRSLNSLTLLSVPSLYLSQQISNQLKIVNCSKLEPVSSGLAESR